MNQDPSDWEGKHSFNNEEEDEPPPPYTEVDPLDIVKGSTRRLSDQVNGNRRSLTPGILPAEGTGPQSFPVLNRTRSDEPATAAARHVRIHYTVHTCIYIHVWDIILSQCAVFFSLVQCIVQ